MNEADLPPEAQEALRRLRGLGDDASRAVADAKAQLRAVEQAAEDTIGRVDERHRAFEALVTNRLAAGPLLAEAWADYETLLARAQADVLRVKSRPAKSAAVEIKEKGRELAKARREAKQAEWVLRFYEASFPWLTDLRDLEAERDYVEGEPRDTPGGEDRATATGDGDDPVAGWLTTEELAGLSSAERSQRALDRYLASRKSAWQAGRDYERYIGYLRERDGCRVTYHGIFAGLEDLGRDLIVHHPDGDIEVVQCKRWAKHKTIHEKHVFQLFGTVVACRIEQPDQVVRGTFTTTTGLSERALQFAEQLDIAIEANRPLEDYPRIKCNIGRGDGDRIYHLPFDQQYDTTVIERVRGELWAATTQEAEDAGFRRAWRWRAGSAATT